MRFQNAKDDVCFILSWFSGAFSRPSFKLFSSFIVGFIQLGKEAHTSSMVKTLSALFWKNPFPVLPAFWGRTLGGSMRLWIWRCRDSSKPCGSKPVPSSFLSWMTRYRRKRERKFLAAPGIKTMRGTWPMSLAISGFWRLCFGRTLLCLSGPDSIILERPKVVAVFRRKSPWPKSWSKAFVFRSPANSTFWPIAGIGPKNWSKSVGIWLPYDLAAKIQFRYRDKRETDPRNRTGFRTSAYREISLSLYGKNKTLKIAKWIGTIKGMGQVAVVVVKEKGKKTRYLVSTNLYLPALEIVKYYAKRWKIEQMIKDLKQRLGFGDYQVRNPGPSIAIRPWLF